MAKDSNFTNIFLNKLKDQSFTIILLVGIMYYQNNLFNNQMDEYKKIIKEKEELILKLTDDERNRLLGREKYLIEQRDQFIEMIKNK